jgi:hypothetical protein
MSGFPTAEVLATRMLDDLISMRRVAITNIIDNLGSVEPAKAIFEGSALHTNLQQEVSNACNAFVSKLQANIKPAERSSCS